MCVFLCGATHNYNSTMFKYCEWKMPEQLRLHLFAPPRISAQPGGLQWRPAELWNAQTRSSALWEFTKTHMCPIQMYPSLLFFSLEKRPTLAGWSLSNRRGSNHSVITVLVAYILVFWFCSYFVPKSWNFSRFSFWADWICFLNWRLLIFSRSFPACGRSQTGLSI